MINHEYEGVPKISKKKTGRKIIRNDEDKNTKTYVLDNDKLRTTADCDGEEIIKGLEFINVTQIEVKGELQEFIKILRLLETRNHIKSINIIVGDLPEGTVGKRFSKLRDGVTKRRYVIAEIVMKIGKEFSLIEVEREDKALSMLLLEMNRNIKSKSIYSLLLLGLVNGSGNWSNDKIEKIEANGTKVYRIKHINKNILDKENHIYNKL